MSKALLDGGLTGPTCYYKVQVRGLGIEDDLSTSAFIPSFTSIFDDLALSFFVTVTTSYPQRSIFPSDRKPDLLRSSVEGLYWRRRYDEGQRDGP